jgi:hypothetical protein
MSGKRIPVHRRKRHTSELIEKATAEGEPLPLEILLESMWRPSATRP